jgi:hypothetical protein
VRYRICGAAALIKRTKPTKAASAHCGAALRVLGPIPQFLFRVRLIPEKATKEIALFLHFLLQFYKNWITIK